MHANFVENEGLVKCNRLLEGQLMGEVRESNSKSLFTSKTKLTFGSS